MLSSVSTEESSKISYKDGVSEQLINMFENAKRMINEIPEEISTKEEKQKYDNIIEKSISLFKKILLDLDIQYRFRAQVLIELLWYISDEGEDCFQRYRDMLPHLDDDKLLIMIKLLIIVANHKSVDLYQRFITGVTLYNRGCFECYNIFKSIISYEEGELNIKVDEDEFLYKVECCKFLFASENDNYKEYAQEYLLELINNMKYSSKKRYGVIADYITRIRGREKGLRSAFISKKLRVEYDEKYVYGLQAAFFYNENNDVRERILSGQHIIDMNCVVESEKNDICETLITIGKLQTYDENVRGDALDVVMRLGSESQRELATYLIKELGYSKVNKNSDDIMQRVRTFYNNSQNAHDIDADAIEKFVEDMINDKDYIDRSYDDVLFDVKKILKDNIQEEEKLNIAYSSLERIGIDTATFTKFKVTSVEVFKYVFDTIRKYRSTNATTSNDLYLLLERLFIDEIIAMNGTCSSGHYERFILVLTPVNNSIKISFSDQIIANIAGRMSMRNRNLSEDEQGMVSIGMMDNPDEESLKFYKSFLEKSKKEIKDELYNEFVKAGYLNNLEFENAFERGMKEWIR